MEDSNKRSGFTHEDRGSKNIEWYTPPWIFEKLGLKFDLDPCHPEQVIPYIPAFKTDCEKDDGLKQPWNGLVWCNPPYGKFTKDWLKKMHEHRNGVALVFSRTDCKWFHDYAAKADAILFLNGRVAFVDGLGVTGNSSSACGSMLIGWGEESVKALKGMRDCGHLVFNKS